METLLDLKEVMFMDLDERRRGGARRTIRSGAPPVGSSNLKSGSYQELAFCNGSAGSWQEPPFAAGSNLLAAGRKRLAGRIRKLPAGLGKLS